MSTKSYVENARILIALADADGKPLTFFDEEDQTVHGFENGVLSIFTDFVDYTTYKLTPVGQAPDITFDVQVERFDDYRRNDKAKMVVCEFDADDEEDLAERLERLVDQLRIEQNKKPATKSEAASLDAMIIPVDEWEWKEWPEVGTGLINDALVENEIAISLVYPTEKQIRKVFAGDFDKSILGWFRDQLNPHGWTLVALAPYDELQAFALVKSGDLETVRALLKKQGRLMK